MKTITLSEKEKTETLKKEAMERLRQEAMGSLKNAIMSLEQPSEDPEVEQKKERLIALIEKFSINPNSFPNQDTNGEDPEITKFLQNNYDEIINYKETINL